MDYILTAYSRQTYQEYRLPIQQNGGTADIPLPGTLTGLDEDLLLSLRWQNGRLELLPSRAYTLRPAEGRRHFPLPLEAGGICFLKPESGGGRIVLTVRMAESSAPAFLAFRLDKGVPFTIGSAPGNMLTYSGGKTVSETHAVITDEGGAHRLEDRSCNGVYVNRKRLACSSLLAFGDQIHILGLLLVYLGEGLAVEVSAAGLHIHESLIPIAGDALKESLSRALALHGFQKAASTPGSATVLINCDTSETETVLENAIVLEEETVLEDTTVPEDETVLEDTTVPEDETVLEDAAVPEDETVLEDTVPEDKTVLEDTVPEDKTVLEDTGGFDIIPLKR